MLFRSRPNWSLWQKKETITFANPDIDQSDAFISGGENMLGRFILAGLFVMIAKPEIAKGSILKRFSLSCLKFQRINQDKKRSYFAGTAAENEDNC